jgi:hypothetical protein
MRAHNAVLGDRPCDFEALSRTQDGGFHRPYGENRRRINFLSPTRDWGALSPAAATGLIGSRGGFSPRSRWARRTNGRNAAWCGRRRAGCRRSRSAIKRKDALARRAGDIVWLPEGCTLDYDMTGRRCAYFYALYPFDWAERNGMAEP